MRRSQRFARTSSNVEPTEAKYVIGQRVTDTITKTTGTVSAVDKFGLIWVYAVEIDERGQVMRQEHHLKDVEISE